MNKKILETQNIRKVFQVKKTTHVVLENISATFYSNHSYAITGKSGTGKSTFIHILAGIDEPTSGHIFCNGQDITLLSASEKTKFRNQTIGLVFQSPYLLRELTVIENVMLPGLIAGISKEICKKRAMTLLEQVHIADKCNAQPTTLSGGQQQRVAIARALYNQPDFLIADEPTGALDTHTGIVIVKLLLDCCKQLNMGLIMSSHDEHITQMVDTVFHVEEGNLKKVK